MRFRCVPQHATGTAFFLYLLLQITIVPLCKKRKIRVPKRGDGSGSWGKERIKVDIYSLGAFNIDRTPL